MEYILPILALTLMTSCWMAVQLIAKRIGTKNHIDNKNGCCGACNKEESCNKKRKV